MSEKGEKDAISTVRRTPIEEENAWVFESLVGFLSGLVWSIPITNFIETKCQEFDPLIEGNEEVHKKIHDEYKQMVDLLLNCFMQDLGITGQQFERACCHADINIQDSPFRKTLFEQIWAAEDHDIFVRMMIQRNTEFQLQALLNREESKAAPETDRDEDRELQQVLWQSFEEHQESIVEMNREKNNIKRVLADTLEEERRYLEAENQRERELLEKAIALSLEDWSEPTTHQNEEKEKAAENTDRISTSLDTVEVLLDSTPDANLSADQQKSYTQSLMERETVERRLFSSRAKKEGISEEDVAKRRAYLNQQRDKLLALKRQEQKKQLVDLEEASNVRPKSARMAIDILENKEHSSNVDSDMLSARKALAARLRAEVVTRKK